MPAVFYGGGTLKVLCKLSLSRDTCVKKTERFFDVGGCACLRSRNSCRGLSIVVHPEAGATWYPVSRVPELRRCRRRVVGRHRGLIIGVLFAEQIDLLFAGASRLGRATGIVIVVLLQIYGAYRWFRRRQLVNELPAGRDRRRRTPHADRCGRITRAVRYPVTGKAQARTGRHSGSEFADERQLADVLARYPRNRKVVIYCSCPNEVSAAWMAKQMTDAGFTDVLPLLGGLDAWRDAGYHLESLPVEPAQPVDGGISPSTV